MTTTKPLNIYVASSWRNLLQPAIVLALRRCQHTVYDFKHPEPGNDGFRWTDIDPAWQSWTPEQYREALQHPVAKHGYALDINALKACDVCVLVLPSGRSASWEFGYAMGQGKRGAVITLDDVHRRQDLRLAVHQLRLYIELFDAFALPGSDLAIKRPRDA